MNTSKTTKLKGLMLAAAVCTAALGLGSCTKSFPAENEEQIRAFLKSQDITVCGEAKSKEITIPEEFGDVYKGYNELQKSQGFDLSNYRAKNAQVYTYSVVAVRGEHAQNTEAHVIVCEDRIIGGDIASPAIDGEMTGLLK